MSTLRSIKGCRCQRGVAALTVALLLLSMMALVALYANRSLLFEQKSSANQYRATRAFEMAEAGIEWATAMLNEARPVDAACSVAATGLSFRERYVPSDARPGLAPLAGVQPSCRISQGALACSCPGSGHDPALGSSDDPSFGIRFSAVAADPDSVQLTAAGCTGQGVQCVPGSVHERSDAVARIRVVLKLRPLLRSLPVSALTAGGTASMAGTSLANLDLGTQGALAVAGRAIDGASATLATLPGSPSVNALFANDPTLERLARADADGGAMFNTFFGMSAGRFKRAAPVYAVTGSSPPERAAALRQAYDAGYSAFAADGDLTFDAAGIGDAARPVLIVTASRVVCSAPCPIHGLLYADIGDRDPGDLANVALHGAAVTRGNHAQAAGSSIAYDAEVLRSLRRRNAVFVRVPGTWLDF